MFAISDPFLWIHFVQFFAVVLIAFFIPGDLLIYRLRLHFFARIVIASIVGMVLWAWQGMVFGYLDTRWFSYLYIVVSIALWINLSLKKENTLPEIERKVLKVDWLLIFLIVTGVFVQVMTVWFTGTLSSKGFLLCCGNASDALFHISLTNQIVNQFPPSQPGMVGMVVQNYHYWSNIVVAELVRVFNLPLVATQYQYMSVFISLFLGLTVIALGQVLKIKKVFTAWLLFFLYFGGDFFYILLLMLGKGLSFGISSMEDGTTFLVNPPRAFSIVVFFAGLSLLSIWLKRRDVLSGLLMAFVLGSAIGFKVYTGLFALIGLAAIGIYFLFKKDFRMVLPLLFMPLVSLLVFLPVNTHSGGLYFTGFWIFENFIVNPVLGLERWELARKVYAEHQSWARVLQYEVMFASIYTFAIFGSKVIGLIQTRKSLALLPKELHVFLLSGILVSAITGFFFQQHSGGANSFNFLVSIFIIGSIYCALICTYMVNTLNRSVLSIFITVVVVATIPRVVYTTIHNVYSINSESREYISYGELEGYAYLQAFSSGSLLAVRDHTYMRGVAAPYISFMTNNPTYLSGEGILESHGINFKDRKSDNDVIFENKSASVVAEKLLSTNIDYILMRPNENVAASESAFFLSTVFENRDIKIVKVSQPEIKEYLEK